MPNRAVEEAHLLQAHHHLTSAQAHIAHQYAIIARQRALGLDTARSEATLRIMQDTLRVMLAHKELIEDALAHDDAAVIARPAIHARAVRSTRGR